MRLAFWVACLILLTQEPTAIQGPLAEIPSGKVIRGRIVLFAWALQWSNAGSDFVVRVAGKEDSKRYVRVIYIRNPQAPKGYYPPLDPMAFVGKGPAWTFYVAKPRYPELQCEIQPDYNYEDGDDRGKIAPYIKTPGAERDDIPSLETLPCYLLVRKGLIPPAGSGVLDPKDGRAGGPG